MRDLCRVDRKLSEEDAKEVLRKASFGTLATINEDGWPYAAPMAFALEGDTLYFHSAKRGQKLENITRDGRAALAEQQAGWYAYADAVRGVLEGGNPCGA